jgi:hypothetical protein
MIGALEVEKDRGSEGEWKSVPLTENLTIVASVSVE